ncbi:hypothetical protein P43SY_007539 [Pythium insidiosum]|uniref:Uncharacterized protein n=1 Tax=Pythium insidiosum TaxID=114742 RepID=A0AAD5M1R9_PYTIN|nr:hypothetical protein P43SY_007539 [Pythium insidiosum]
MTKLRARRQHVDYTDLLSPAAKAPKGTVGRKKSGGGKAEDEDHRDTADDELEDDEPVKVKPAEKRSKQRKKPAREVPAEASKSEEAAEPPRKTSKKKKKARDETSDDDHGATKHVDEPQRKRAKTNAATLAADPAASRPQKPSESALDRERAESTPTARSDADELVLLRKKYESSERPRPSGF